VRGEYIERQIALVSYGTRYLRRELSLEDWYRHGIFWGARLQFRALAGNALLADDFTLWLGILAQSGAVRVSLHPAAELDIAVRGGDYVLVVHFDAYYQLWVLGREPVSWREQLESTVRDQGHSHPSFPDAAHYAAEIDNYWLVGEREGTLDVPNTDWKALTAAIAADLDVTIPVKESAADLVVRPNHGQPDWAKLPLFPESPVAKHAHALLASLYWEQARFANDMNPKNDNSPYQGMDERRAAEVEAWGARLNSWVIEVQLRCANEYREVAVLSKNSPLARIYTAEPVPRRETTAVHSPDIHAPVFATPSDEPAPATSRAKWLDHVGLAIAIGVLSLVILVFANVIAAFPWLSVLIGLPWALYTNLKRSNTPRPSD
jgi:hypothetical protein